jgi:hypothetical protein
MYHQKNIFHSTYMRANKIKQIPIHKTMVTQLTRTKKQRNKVQ